MHITTFGFRPSIFFSPDGGGGGAAPAPGAAPAAPAAPSSGGSAPAASAAPSGTSSPGATPAGGAPSASTPAVPGPGGATGDAGAAGSPSDSPQVQQPLGQQAARTALQRIFQAVTDPTLPEGQVDGKTFMQYQQQVEAARRARTFQSSVLDSMTKPQQYGDVTLVVSSPEEAEQYAGFIGSIMNGERSISGADLLFLFKQQQVLKMASEHGARTFERSRRAPAAAAAAPAASGGGNSASNPVVPKVETKSSDGVPTVAEILQKKNPDFYRKLQAGEVRLT